MSRRDDNVAVGPVRFYRDTPKSWGIRHPGSDRPVWLPKERCEIDTEDPQPGDMVQLNVPRWLAQKEGLD